MLQINHYLNEIELIKEKAALAEGYERFTSKDDNSEAIRNREICESEFCAGLRYRLGDVGEIAAGASQ